MRLFSQRFTFAPVRFFAPDDPASAGDPPAKDDDKPNTDPAKDPDAILASVSDDVKKAFEAKTGGLSSALEKERAERKALEKRIKDAESEKAKKDQESLEANKEFEKLAGELKTKLSDLEPKFTAATAKLEAETARANALQEVVTGLLKSEKDALKLPAEIAELLESKDPLDQLKWIAANKAKLAKAPNGVPPSSAKDDASGEMSDKDKLAMTARTWA